MKIKNDGAVHGLLYRMCWSLILMMTLAVTQSNLLQAQVGDVLWEENFNTLNTDIWTPNVGDGCDIGLCGWGNAELEYYSPNNVSIEPVPGEPGNNALVLEARNESAGSQSFTSGKVDTDGKVSIHYGLIEVRMRVPNLQTGLWPAAWLLGDVNLPWPAKGEIDMMEMGHAFEERERQGYPSATENNYVGANAIWQSSDGSYASIAWDVNYNQPYVPSQALTDRFVTYKLYWEPTSMRFAVEDNGVEYDLYTNPLPLDANGETAAFTKPFYMLLNLAVGGNFTDAATPGQVTAPLPAKMYVDYVRVSEYNGHGSVTFSDGTIPAETGVFGVFTETTPTNNQLDFANDGAIYAWGGTVQEGTTAPYEGTDVIAWETVNPNSWFGGGIVSLYGKNMSNFVENGSLKFKIKIPGDVSFRIGVTDNYTNESYVSFPAGQTTYGLVRDGEWGQVEIPLADLAGIIAFQDLNYMFAIVSDDADIPTSTFQFAIDDVVYDDGNGSQQPVLTSITVSPGNPTIDEGATQQFTAQGYDQNGNPMSTSVTWSASAGSISSGGLYTGTTTGTHLITATSGTVSGNTNITVNAVATGTPVPGRLEAEDYNEGGNGVGYYDLTAGNTGGAYRNDDVDIEVTGDTGGGYNVGWIDAGEWLAFDINAQAPSNTYNLDLRVASPSGSGALHVEVDGVDVTGSLSVPNTGSWQSYATISANNITIAQGSHELRVVFDAPGLNLNFIDVSEAAGQVLSSIVVTPNTADLEQGNTQQFTAQAYDQNGSPMSASFTWSATGGSIDGNGLYSATETGSYNVTASSGSVSGSASVTVTSTPVGWAIPGRIEAENFNGGGEGVGYHDTTTGNTGGAFRMSEDVDIQATGDPQGGLYNVGWIAAGEWLAYDVHTSGGTFDFAVRVASPNGNGRLHIEIDGVDVTGNLVVPNTGGWQNYVTVTAENITVSSGNHVMRVVFDAAGLNLNYVETSASSQQVLTSIAITPGSATLQTGGTQQFTAQAYDQNGNPMSASFNWSASCGSINSSGLYTASTVGNCTVTCSSGSVVANASVTVSGAANCTGGPSNGDYTYTVSGGNSPEITFEPGYAGVGDNIVILYYGTSPTGSYPGYIVTPNVPYALGNANPGETIYFYYTYSVPEGGERNTAANRHNFVVGDCGSSARVGNDLASGWDSEDALLLYPVPAGNHLKISTNGNVLEGVQVFDMSGRLIDNLETSQHSGYVKLNTSRLIKGSYLLKVVMNGNTMIKQFIKD